MCFQLIAGVSLLKILGMGLTLTVLPVYAIAEVNLSSSIAS